MENSWDKRPFRIFFCGGGSFVGALLFWEAFEVFLGVQSWVVLVRESLVLMFLDVSRWLLSLHKNGTTQNTGRHASTAVERGMALK